ncbi:hypothetical protein [Parasphingorhabdus litoris]|uniref:hypothetical protein n=2 Tax=Parasphingorhabdus litoris TaxID=394733 RepID=UPI003CD0798E
MSSSGPFNLRSGIPYDVGATIRAGTLTTRGSLTFLSSTMDSKVRAFDIRTGEAKWKADLPSNGQSTPMSYRDRSQPNLAIPQRPCGKPISRLVGCAIWQRRLCNCLCIRQRLNPNHGLISSKSSDTKKIGKNVARCSLSRTGLAQFSLLLRFCREIDPIFRFVDQRHTIKRMNI